MSNLITFIQVQHQDTGMSFSVNSQRTADEAGISAASINVGTADEVVDTSEFTDPRLIMLRLMSGDDVQVGLNFGTDGIKYPFRLSGDNDYTVIRLDVEGIREITSITAGAGLSGLAGDHIELRELGDTKVWPWFNMALKAKATITYGAPAVAVAATGSITYGIPVDTDTVIVNGTTLTKVAATPGANEFTSIMELEALVEALSGINSSENGTTVSITAATAGHAGNAITLALGGGNTGTMGISGGTLTGGLDATSVIVNGTTLTYVASAPTGNQFSNIAELTALIAGLSFIDATDNGTTVSLAAEYAGSIGNVYTLALGTNIAGTTSVSGNFSGGTDSSTAPTPSGGERLIPVVVGEDYTAAEIATALASALDLDAGYSAIATDAVVRVTDAHIGVRGTATAGTTGWAAPVESQVGAISPVIHLKSTGTSQVLVAVAPA